MSDYYLQVTLKSNKNPWSTEYRPLAWHPFKNDEEAIEWAQDMNAGLGDIYNLTLIKDGTVLSYEV